MGRNFCHRPQPGPWTLGWEESRDWLTPLNAADPFLKTRLAGLSCQPPGQPDIYFGALPGNGFDLDFPPMITDDLMDFGQAHTGAVGFGGEKGVEEIGQVLGRNADPGVPQV